MVTADTISRLRAKGGTDDEIIQFLGDRDPQFAETVGRLQTRGGSNKEIVDFFASRPMPDGMEDSSTWDKIKGAVQYGTSEAARGVDKTLETLGVETGRATAQEVQQIARPTGYTPASSGFRDSNRSVLDRAGYIPRMLLEGAPGLVSDVAAGAVGSAVGGPIGGGLAFGSSYAARNLGDNAQARSDAAGNKQITGSDLAVAGVQTVAEAALNKLGLKAGVGAPATTVAGVGKEIAKAGATNAALGAASGTVSEAGRTLGTDTKFDVSRPIEDAAIGGAAGLAGRTALATGDVANAIKFRDIDKTRAGRLANRFGDQNIDPSDPSKAFEAVQNVDANLKADIREGYRQAKPLLKTLDNESDIRQTIDELRGNLNRGSTIPEERLQVVRDAIGNDTNGSRLVTALEDLNTLNQLKSKGNFDKKTGFFGGGVSSTDAIRLIDPTDKAGFAGKLAAALGGSSVLPGVAGLGQIAQIATTAGLASKALAAQAALVGGARGLDKITGLRNPTEQFVKRFANKNLPSPEVTTDKLGDLRIAKEDAIYEAKAAREQARVDKQNQQVPDKQKDYAQAQKAAQAQQKLESRKQTEIDRAFASKEVDPLTKAKQEEAMWRQAETQKKVQTEDLDLALEQADAARRGVEIAKLQESLLRGQQVVKAQEAARKLTEGLQAKLAALDAKQAKQASAASATPANANPVFAGMTNKEVAGIRRTIQGIAKLDRLKKKANPPEKTSKPTSEAKTETKASPRPQEKQEKPNTQSTKPDDTVDVVSVTKHGITVQAPKENVKKEAAWKAKIIDRLNTRHEFVSELRPLVGKKHAVVLDELERSLSSTKIQSREGASAIIDEHLNRLPDKVLSQAYDIFNKHEAKVLSTFAKEK